MTDGGAFAGHRSFSSSAGRSKPSPHSAGRRYWGLTSVVLSCVTLVFGRAVGHPVKIFEVNLFDDSSTVHWQRQLEHLRLLWASGGRAGHGFIRELR